MAAFAENEIPIALFAKDIRSCGTASACGSGAMS